MLKIDNKPRSAALQEALEQGKRREVMTAEILTVREACAYTKVSRWKLYDAMHNGKLAYIKIGARRLIRMREVQRYLDECTISEAA